MAQVGGKEAAAQSTALNIKGPNVLDPGSWLGVQRFAPAPAIGPVREGVAGGLCEDENQRRGDQEPDVFAEAIREYYSTSNRSKKSAVIKLTKEQLLIHHPNGVFMSNIICKHVKILIHKISTKTSIFPASSVN
ncbi:hypothetical protein [Bradyrhizobium sp. SYSU BS000235]|uniref:hypothetical protein n=1 Tax=Bradyrhizobium sp. SYSU BS000235 TaxID=3411332 RepID=UPI003C737494